MNGASLSEISEVLGHKPLQMVKRYAHLSEAHTSKAMGYLTFYMTSKMARASQITSRNKVGNIILKNVAKQKITPEQAKSLMNVLAIYRDTCLIDKLGQEINEIKVLLSQNKDIV